MASEHLSGDICAKAQKSKETEDGGALSMRRSAWGITITTRAGHSLSKPELSIHFHVWMFSLCLVTIVIMICEMGRNNTWWYLT